MARLWDKITRFADVFCESWFSRLPRCLHIFIILPFLVALVFTYPFFQSLGETTPARVLTHHAISNGTIGNLFIRQAVVVPPVFVPGEDKRILDFVKPLTDLAEEVTKSRDSDTSIDTLPRLISVFDFPKRNDNPGRQCLLFSYFYANESDAAPWLDALAKMTTGPLPRDEIHLVDASEISSATLPSWVGSTFSLWPGCSPFVTTALTCFWVVLILGWVRRWNDAPLRSASGVALACFTRYSLALLCSMSVTSVLFADFSFAVLKGYLILPIMMFMTIFMLVTKLIEYIHRVPGDHKTSLVKLLYACKSMKPVMLRSEIGIAIGCMIMLIFPVNRMIKPSLFMYGLSMILDVLLHMTFFSSVLYIDLVHREHYDFSNDYFDGIGAEEPSPRINVLACIFNVWHRVLVHASHFEKKVRDIMPLSRLAYLTQGAVILFVASSASRLLSSIHPHLTKHIDDPAYVDLFVMPDSAEAAKFHNYEVFIPVILSVGRDFTAPTAKAFFTFTTLRYGNTWSVVLEIMMLAIFVGCVGMAVYIFLMPPELFNLRSYLPEREHFNVCSLQTGQDLDIVLIETDKNMIASASLDHILAISDGSPFLCDDPPSNESIHTRAVILPLTRKSWPLKKVLLNAAAGHVAIFHHESIELWNIRLRQKIYTFQHDEALSTMPLCFFFTGTSLIFVTNSARVVELYCKERPKVIHLTRCGLPEGALRLATKVSNDRARHVTLMVCNSRNELFKVRRFKEGTWEVDPLPVLQSIFALDRGRSGTPAAWPTLDATAWNTNVPWTQPLSTPDNFDLVLPMQDIELSVLISKNRAGFFDTNTGVFIRFVQIGTFRPGSVRAFHSQPRHCAFCGCTAVASISICYFDEDHPHTMVCHTYRLGNRHRNDICLRVERDPRETRCLGLGSAHEECHWLENVEVWDITAINTLMGVRKKQIDYEHEDSGHGNPHCSTTSESEIALQEMRKRTPVSTPRTSIDSDLCLNEWECFAMSANGVVSFTDIPLPINGDGDRCEPLLIDKVTTIGRVGTTAVCVGLGNVLEILHLGHASL